jgi:hypothetical protein
LTWNFYFFPVFVHSVTCTGSIALCMNGVGVYGMGVHGVGVHDVDVLAHGVVVHCIITLTDRKRTVNNLRFKEYENKS